MAKASKDNIEPIEKFFPDENQPRKYFNPEALQGLADSISERGQLYPILYREVAEDEGTKFIIVDGERRWRACKDLLGLKDIKAIKIDATDHEVVALIGNIVREELTAMEESLAVNKLKLKMKEEAKKAKTKEKDKITNEKLGKILVKAESTISEILKLVNLPEFIQAVAKENKDWSRAKLLKLAKKRDKSRQEILFENMKKEIELGKRSRVTKAKIETAKTQIESFTSKLTKIEADWNPDEKKALKQHLTELSKAIAGMLKGV